MNTKKKDNRDKTFKASNGWCIMFKKRWNLSTQKIKCSKIASNTPDNNEINAFLDKYDTFTKNIKKKFIFNYDEIGYNIANSPKTAIRCKGSNHTKIDCKNNLKENITLGLTVSAGGSFLKPLLIAKGKTDRCLNKYNLDDGFLKAYNKKGWADEDCIILILKQISSITKNDNSLLLMDQYRSHKTKKVTEYAKSKNITILYIPVGLTGKYQPLDVSINGILKSKAIKSYSIFLASNSNEKYTYDDCINNFLRHKKEIKKGTIMRSFNCLDRSKSK